MAFSPQYLPITCTKQQGPVCSCTFFRKIFLCCNNVYYSGTDMVKSSRKCRFYCIFVRFVSSFLAYFPDKRSGFSDDFFIIRQHFTKPFILIGFFFFSSFELQEMESIHKNTRLKSVIRSILKSEICKRYFAKNKRKGSENMYQKRKYKAFILLCLILDLLAMVFLGYRLLR